MVNSEDAFYSLPEDDQVRLIAAEIIRESEEVELAMAGRHV